MGYLAEVTQGAQRVGEIGFNAGYSAVAMLNNPGVEVVSFDLCRHRSARMAKRLIDRKYPGRHSLICGDSRTTVPQYAEQHPDVKFGVVFIDGDHSYAGAKADLANMRLVSTEETIVVFDDMVPWAKYGQGPVRAWGEAVDAGWVKQEELVQGGRRVEELKPPGLRAWVRGRYLGVADVDAS
ncbi:class I SAM-dependent methyltransferase [Mycobacterium sp. NPDC051804]|uniref:class I SAM-dependent methyltransferase n=1 Tax=Mycobacterium sp. NPDC051804 TaxID=3364295 RepID=UPI0037A5B326